MVRISTATNYKIVTIPIDKIFICVEVQTFQPTDKISHISKVVPNFAFDSYSLSLFLFLSHTISLSGGMRFSQITESS